MDVFFAGGLCLSAYFSTTFSAPRVSLASSIKAGWNWPVEKIRANLPRIMQGEIDKLG